MLTTGQLAAHAAISEKAVRLYADRGLLTATRDASGRRIFDGAQAERARTIALLRSLDLSLSEVAEVIDAHAPLRVFDTVWERRRARAAGVDAAGEYARSVLSGTSALPAGLAVGQRQVTDRVVLRVDGDARLSEMGAVIAGLTQQAFSALTAADVPVAAPPFLEIHTRATEVSTAKLTLSVPFDGLIPPPPGMHIARDEAHAEMVVSLDQAEADDQPLVVAVHDHLSRAAGAQRRGPNREIYLPGFGSGAAGTVMEIAVPVDPAGPSVA
ncbi:MerR family transcriptional regulator [Microbacterium sp. TNHR37B]|uniref:MerR family transcriptional regulator n=1 Tax=Microbacterium sp. TNHR37B TaxID=1775956 RepID=UPI00082A07BD|nr:MerR family transcriptional regulator [Microbacterium sp. TNHR37B]